MKKINIDVFKIALVAILLGFLFLFYQYSQNGRFYLTHDSLFIIDSRTGVVWHISNNKDEKLYCNPVQK